MVYFYFCVILFVSIVTLPYSTNSMALRDNPCDQPDTVNSNNENVNPNLWPYFHTLHNFVSKLSSSKCNQHLLKKIKRHNPINVQIDPTNDLDEVENIQGAPKPIQNINDDPNQTLNNEVETNSEQDQTLNIDSKDDSNQIDSNNDKNSTLNNQIDPKYELNTHENIQNNLKRDSTTTQNIEFDLKDDPNMIDTKNQTNMNIQNNPKDDSNQIDTNNETNLILNNQIYSKDNSKVSENIQNSSKDDSTTTQNIQFDLKDYPNKLVIINETNPTIHKQIDPNLNLNPTIIDQIDSNDYSSEVENIEYDQNDDSTTTQIIEIDPIDDPTHIDLNTETNNNNQIISQNIPTEPNNQNNPDNDDDYDDEPDIVTQECYNNILSECGHAFIDSFSNKENDIQQKCESRVDFNSCLQELQLNCTELAEVDVKPVNQEFRLKLAETIWASRVCMFLPRRD